MVRSLDIRHKSMGKLKRKWVRRSRSVSCHAFFFGMYVINTRNNWSIWEYYSKNVMYTLQSFMLFIQRNGVLSVEFFIHISSSFLGGFILNNFESRFYLLSHVTVHLVVVNVCDWIFTRKLTFRDFMTTCLRGYRTLYFTSRRNKSFWVFLTIKQHSQLLWDYRPLIWIQ